MMRRHFHREQAIRVRHSQGGYTIVELLIATAVFSVVMLLCALAIVHVGKMFYKGVVTNRTQDAARQVIDNVTAAIQFGNEAEGGMIKAFRPAAGAGTVAQSTVCIGKTRYTYAPATALGAGTGKSTHVLWRDRVVNECYTADTSSPDYINLMLDNPGGGGGQELLGANMRMPKFKVTQDGALWSVTVRIAYGDTTDLFLPGSEECDPQPDGGCVNNGETSAGAIYTRCKGTNAGGQFCAVSELNTSVTKRL